MYNKAYMINHALGCDRDLAEVIRLYTLAQEAGDADAMSNLGLIYMEQERFDLARPCLERASELGNKNGIFNKLLLDFTEGKCLQDIHTQEKSIQERFFRAISNLLKENTTQENIDSAKSALTEIIEISQDPDMTQNAQDLLDYAQNLLMSNKGSSGEEETLDWKEDLKQELAQYANKNKKNQRNKKQVYITDSMESSSTKIRRNQNQIKQLKAFINGDTTVKKSNLPHLLHLLGSQSTKKGYIIKGDTTISGHNPHNKDRVDEAAVKGLITIAKAIVTKNS
jgi:tetratricopeptide (TPR) repeat protein